MKVKIYTDGAARGNPDGPGGYGTVLEFIDSKGQLHTKELSCGYKKTTNNRMELMAAFRFSSVVPTWQVAPATRLKLEEFSAVGSSVRLFMVILPLV